MKTVRLLFAIVGLGLGATGLGLAEETARPASAAMRPQKEAATDPESPSVQGNGNQPNAGRESVRSKRPSEKGEGKTASGKSDGTNQTKTNPQGRAVLGRTPPFAAPAEPPGGKSAGEVPTQRASGTTLSPPGRGVRASPGGTTTGSAANEMENQSRPPGAGLARPLPKAELVKRRGPGTAVIGGVAMSNVKSTAALSGTGMRQRH